MRTGSLTLLDWAVVLVYFAAMVFVAMRFRRRQSSSSAYFLGSGKIPGWAVGMSLFATIISSWAFLALPAKAFQSDLQYLMAIGAVPVAAWFGVRWFVPFFRDRIKLSAYEYLERRFGLGARLYGNVAFLVVHFGKMAGILYLLCLALAEMTGANIFVLIAVVGVSTVVYTFFGGMDGVVWTDVAQGFLLVFAGIVTVGFILYSAPGGAAAVLETAWDGGKFRLIGGGFDWGKSGTLLLLLFGLNFYTQKYVADQTVVQRYLVAPSEQKARGALWLSSFLVMFVWVLFMVVGVLLWAFYRLQPGELPAELLAKPDKIYPYFIGYGLPAGVSGFILAGLLAATMSTLSSDLNCLSAVVFDDYYRKLRPGRSDREHLLFSRLVVLVAGILGVVLAMAMTRVHSMADAAFDFVSAVGGGVLGMYLLGMVTRVSARALYVGLAAGIAVVLWAYFCGPNSTRLPALPRSPFHGLWVGLLGNCVVFCVGWLAGRVMKPQLQPANVSL
jgi:solute:Na+ symporter, SSS family